MAAFSDDIDHLEEILRVYRQLGAEREPRLATLVAPFRKLERVEEIQMRRAPFSAHVRTPARLFLFNDMVLLAEELPEEPEEPAQPLLGRMLGSLQQTAARWSVRRAPASASTATPPAPADAARPTQAQRRATRRSQLSRGSTRSFSTDASADSSLRLAEVMELHKCKASRVSSEAGEAGFELRHVFRTRGSDGKPVTQIDKVEIWCEALDQADALFADVERCIETLLDLEEQERAAADALAGHTDGDASDGGSSVASGPSFPGRGSLVSSGGASSGAAAEAGPRRKWARAKGNMHRKNGTLTSSASGAASAAAAESDDESARGRSDSQSSGGLSGSAHGQDRVGGLTLADLESRYRVASAAAPGGSGGGTVGAGADAQQHDAAFSVVFGEGAMGFSLSSSAGLGVIVGRVAADGMASVGGVEVGDRLTHVGGAEVSVGTAWRDAVEQIKLLPRPVELAFLRNFSVNSQVAHAEAARRASKQRGAAASASASAALSGTGAGSSRGSARRANGSLRSKTSTGTPGQRKWVERHARSGNNLGARLTSLEDLANMYRVSKAAAASADDDASGAATADGASVTSSGSAARRARTAQEERDRELAEVSDMFDELQESPSENVRACASTLREMFDTERAYVRDLGLIVGEYLLPLRRTVRRVRCCAVEHGSTFCEHRNLRSKCSKTSKDSRPVMEAEDVKDVFLNVETLVKINSELLAVLRGGIAAVARGAAEVGSGGGTVTELVHVFAPAFVRVMPFFRIYSLYCHSYTAAIDKLLVARSRNRHLDELIKEREHKSRTTLQHLLIKPVQRICKYPLLFQGLLKAVVPFVAEEIERGADVERLDALVEDLEKALSVVDRIAKSVNDKIGEQESLGLMMDVYAELGGEAAVPDLVSPSRRFLDKTDTLVRAMPFDESSPLRHELLYVFNDHLVFARGANAGYGTLNSARTGPLRKLSANKGGSLSKHGGANAQLLRSTSNKSGAVGKKSSLAKMMSFRRNSGGDKRADAAARKKSAASAGGSSSAGASSISRVSRSTSVSSGSSGNGGRTSGHVRAAIAAVTLRVDLRRAKIDAVAEPDDTDCFGAVLSFRTRIKVPAANAPAAPGGSEDARDDASDRPGRKGSRKGSRTTAVPSSAASASGASVSGASATGPVPAARTRTTVDRVQLWFPTQEKRDQMLRLLGAQIENLQRLDEITQSASQSVGAKVPERAWKTKQRNMARTRARLSQHAAGDDA